jgi:CRISPR-associated endonuclease Csn1
MMNQRRGFKSGRKDLKENTTMVYGDFRKLCLSIEAGNEPVYNASNGELRETRFVVISRIKSVNQRGEVRDGKGNLTFEITAEDGRLQTWEEKKRKKPDWEGREFTFVVTQKIDRKGKLTQLKPQTPTEDDWSLTMTALDNQIDEALKHPGEFFFDRLAKDPNYKIRQYTVRREKYKKELEAIWNKQVELRKKGNSSEEILNGAKLPAIASALYKHNHAKRKELEAKGLFHVLANDIIYYQRELKSQKNSVGECRYEKHKDTKGEVYGVKCAPISCPEFQEFRIWQDVHNIRIVEKEQRSDGGLKIDVDVTKSFIDDEAKEKLFELFDGSKEVSEKQILSEVNRFSSKYNLSEATHRITLFANRDKLAGNETKDLFRKIFKKQNYEVQGEKLLADRDLLRKLWHCYYSITSSDAEKSVKGMRAALSHFKFPQNVIDAFARIEYDASGKIMDVFLLPEPKKQYAAYSAKAINKLLALMRCGKYWSWENVAADTKERIEKIVRDGRVDFAHDKRTGELIKEREFSSKEQFSGLPVWMACYAAYGRHSERESDKKYEKPEEMDVMKLIPNNSLRNPIVEQVVRETLLVVRDVWKQFGQIDEIHIELARDLKKNAKEREKISEINAKNLEEKQRIKKLLSELVNSGYAFEANPNPENPIDIEKFRIYKSCSTATYEEEQSEWGPLFKGGKNEPTSSELKKYALWLSQKCASPYTGKMISLTKLFSEEYEVEHIIPRKKMKNDSFDNLVICESGVNKLKDNELAMAFIQQNGGAEQAYGSKSFKLFSVEEYIAHCKATFKRRKLQNLLATEVPEDFVERQINDTRYITRKIGELLYPVAKDKAGLVFTIGSITSELKGEWGLHAVWKDIVKPRFERLEGIMKEKMIVQEDGGPGKFHFTVPNQPDFNVKRIDHRHHALDALIVAATTREHIRYLNSLSAVDTNAELQQVKRALVKRKIREFKLPWEDFIKDVKTKLQETVVTFKSNTKIVSKPSNKYRKWVQTAGGGWRMEELSQKPNDRWLAVRKSMFKEPQGAVWLKQKVKVTVPKAFEIQIERMNADHDLEKRKTASYVYDKVARQCIKEIIRRTGIGPDQPEQLLAAIQEYLKKNKIKNGVYSLEGNEYENVVIAEFQERAAKRVALDASFGHDKIDKIPYASAGEGKINIAVLLHRHLREYKDDSAKAFIGEGMEALTKRVGRRITKVTIAEKKSPKDKFGKKFVEVDAGSNAYFVMYENESTKERTGMDTLATHKAIERIVVGEPIAEKKEGFKTIMLSPGDLVYVPSEEEERNEELIDWNNKSRISQGIYKMVKSTGKQCFFIPASIAKLIIPYDASMKKGEIESQNCSQKVFDGERQVKQVCIKINVDRLGNINNKRAVS